MDVIWLVLVKMSVCLPLRGYPPAPTLLPFRSATGISYASNKLSKMAGNLASYSLNSWWIDRLFMQVPFPSYNASND